MKEQDVPLPSLPAMGLHHDGLFQDVWQPWKSFAEPVSRGLEFQTYGIFPLYLGISLWQRKRDP